MIDWTKRGGGYDMRIRVSGESFLTPPGPLSDVMSNAVTEVTGAVPKLSTTGGTSDARFIKDHCPVVEYGLINQTAHKVDEFSNVDDIHQLADVYEAALNNFFKRST